MTLSDPRQGACERHLADAPDGARHKAASHRNTRAEAQVGGFREAVLVAHATFHR
jgi:hypothetical protein